MVVHLICSYFSIMNTDNIRYITKYTFSTIMHIGFIVCGQGNIYCCNDWSIYFRITLVNMFVLCSTFNTPNLFALKHRIHPHLVVYHNYKSMLNEVRTKKWKRAWGSIRYSVVIYCNCSLINLLYNAIIYRMLHSFITYCEYALYTACGYRIMH